jgi:hypothetical protein
MRCGVAGIARAIGIEVATQVESAGRTSAAAAAIYAGFIAVLDSVRASRREKCASTRGAYLASGAGVAANAAVESIVASVDLATIYSIVITILEAGIAGLDGARSCLAASRSVVD